MANATLTTAQKAAVSVTDYAGNPVPLSGVVITTDASGCLGWAAPNGQLEVLGQSAGTGTLTVTYGSASGALTVDVTDAPLVVTMGTPVPK